MKDWRVLLLLGVAICVFSIRIYTLPQASNRQYENVTLKLNPTEFKMSRDLLSGTASNGKETFSILINEKINEIKQKDNKIIYLQTNDFELSKIKGPTNISETNFKKYFFCKNIFRSLKINSFKMSETTPRTINDHILLMRWRLNERFAELPSTLRFNTNSLLIGVNEASTLSTEYLADFSKLGIIHLFSLSGMHLMLLISFLKKIISKFKICTVETLESFLFIILPLYCILVGTKTSICRATILVLVKIAFNKLEIEKTSTEIFGVSLILGLLLDPKCLLMLGGQLTYLLSFSLIYLHKLSVFKIAFIINVLCMPLIILNNYEINLATIPINILIIPIFEFFILPSTILAGMIGTEFTPITNLFEYLNALIYSVGHQISQIRVLQIITGKFWMTTVVALLVLGLIIISDKTVRIKCIKLFIVILSVNILVNKIPLNGQVTLIDIGQGDSILITTPISRQTFLIDTGGKLSFGGRKITNFNVDKITIPYLKSQGINKIDAIFLSHQDADHIGDLSVLLKHFNVGAVYFGNGMQKNEKIQKVLRLFVNQVSFKMVQAGDLIEFKNIKFNVLSPLKPGIGENEDSMVLLTKICGKKWIFTGDLNREKELEVMNKYHPNVDYLKVGHHGSKTSSDPEFIKQLNPKIAFISVGKKNRYGHPNKETIDTLKANNVKIFETSECGMITWQYNFRDEYKLKSFIGS